MKRVALFGIAVTMTTSLLFAGQAEAASPAKVSYGVNFREQPSTNANVHRMLKKGENIQVLEQVNSYWLKVQDSNGRIGYISSNSKYIDYIQGTIGTTAKAVKGVNFRSAPKVANNKIGFIRKGSTVQVLEQVNSYWLKVNYNGKVGYASINYFDYTSGGSKGSGSAPVQTPGSASASAIVATALSYEGKFQYKFGAEPWNTNYKYSDCSAFVQLVFNRIHGHNLPRTSKNQAKQGSYVAKSNLKPGDLVFFDTTNDGVINHVGIYIGNGEFIHSSPSNKVGINSLDKGYWSNRYITARRVL